MWCWIFEQNDKQIIFPTSQTTSHQSLFSDEKWIKNNGEYMQIFEHSTDIHIKHEATTWRLLSLSCVMLNDPHDKIIIAHMQN